MAKKSSRCDANDTAVVTATVAAVPRPRLHKLTVRNFRAIGDAPVTIELDDIVVLVGPNNSGKSSLLRAYEVVMLHGSKECELTAQDFPDSRIDPSKPIEIELETVVYDEKAPGDKWIRKDPETGEMFVRERWSWCEPGKPRKVGWDVAKGDWDEKEGPWGAPGVAQPARPEPHRILAFDSPEIQAQAVVKLLKDVLNARIKELQSAQLGDDNQPNDYQKLIDAITAFQTKAVQDANAKITEVESELNALIGEVFPGQVVRFDARSDGDVEGALNFFKDTPQLLMGPPDGYQPAIDRQGSGARRTVLWAALRLLAEQNRAKKDATSPRPHVLLMDEPELCLHPDAVREARRVLYDLPRSGRWQVMVTTHSPVFIDLARDNTSIVRVERSANGQASGTTIYRPNRARLSEDDRESLKLLNVCDPYVAEFFFGGRTIVVEGDTEFTAFRYLIDKDPATFRGLHIVRARGKATIRPLCKILNQFNAPYAVLHDSDHPTIERLGKTVTNPAWTLNSKILETIEDQVAKGSVMLVASVPNFESAYFGKEVNVEKPFNAWVQMRDDLKARTKVAALLACLAGGSGKLPHGALAWSAINQLDKAVKSGKH